MYCIIKCIVQGKQTRLKNADLRHPSCNVKTQIFVTRPQCVKEIERSGVDLICVARDRDKRRAVVNPADSELSGFVKCEEFRDQLRNC